MRFTSKMYFLLSAPNSNTFNLFYATVQKKLKGLLNCVNHIFSGWNSTSRGSPSHRDLRLLSLCLLQFLLQLLGLHLPPELLLQLLLPQLSQMFGVRVWGGYDDVGSVRGWPLEDEGKRYFLLQQRWQNEIAPRSAACSPGENVFCLYVGCRASWTGLVVLWLVLIEDSGLQWHPGRFYCTHWVLTADQTAEAGLLYGRLALGALRPCRVQIRTRLCREKRWLQKHRHKASASFVIPHLFGNLVNRKEVFFIQDAVSESVAKTSPHDE